MNETVSMHSYNLTEQWKEYDYTMVKYWNIRRSQAPRSNDRDLIISSDHTEAHQIRRRFGGPHGVPPYPSVRIRYSFVEKTTRSFFIEYDYDARRDIGILGIPSVIPTSSSAANRIAASTLRVHPRLSTQALTPLKRTVAAEHHRHQNALSRLFCPPPLHSLIVSPTKRTKSSHQSI